MTFPQSGTAGHPAFRTSWAGTEAAECGSGSDSDRPRKSRVFAGFRARIRVETFDRRFGRSQNFRQSTVPAPL